MTRAQEISFKNIRIIDVCKRVNSPDGPNLYLYTVTKDTQWERHIKHGVTWLWHHIHVVSGKANKLCIFPLDDCIFVIVSFSSMETYANNNVVP